MNSDINSYIINKFKIKEYYLEVGSNLDYKILIPNDNEFKNENTKSDRNYFLYYNINNHLDVNPKDIIEITINSEGNRFYNNLAYFFNDNQKI